MHEAQSNKVLQLEKVDSADNAADLFKFAKPLLKAAFLQLRECIVGLLIVLMCLTLTKDSSCVFGAAL